MTTEELQDRIDELPDVIQDHLYDEGIADLNDRILERNGLQDDKLKVITGLVNEAVVKAVPLSELTKEVKGRFGLDDEKSKKLALDVAGYRLLPLDTYLGDVDGLVHGLGGNPDDYPKERIQVEERTTDAAVKDVEGAVAVGELPHRLKSRFEDAVRSYFKGVRTESQLMDILTRAEKIGGVGLDETAATRVIREAQEEKRTVAIEDTPVGGKTEEASGGEGTQTGTPGGTEKGGPAPAKRKETFETVLPEDEEEIAMIKKTLPEEELKKSTDTDAKIKASVEELYQASGVRPATEELQARFRKIIENRLRDIRDQLETLQNLVRPKELGGMSMTEEDARRVLGVIEGKLKAVHARHEEALKEKKATWVAEESRQAVERVETEKSAEAMAREEAFALATSRSKKLSSAGAGTPAMPGVPRPAPPANLPVPSGNAAAPVAPVLSKAAPRPAPGTIMTPPTAIKAPSAPVKQAPPSPIRPPSAAPPPVGRPPMKPMMKDVKAAAPMATGPVEELRTTSLEDFRRLSKDPKEATLKIKDKVDLLGEDSYAKRSQGIAAWQQSGVFRLYMEMMGEALEGKPMAQVISDREAAKKPALKQEEMDAIVQLGVQLRA